jgi:aminoglycoside phosphotransferase (APT) family kinase protein
VAARPRALRRRGRLGLTLRRAAAAFGLDVASLRSLGGASGATWSDGEVVLRVGERVAQEVLAASAAADVVPVPRVLGQIESAVLLELVPGRPAGELAEPEHAAAAGRACGALHDRLAGLAAPAGLRELPGRERNLLHLDLHPYNVLVDDAGDVTAVIDWTNAAAGDPALDVARTWSILTLDPAALARRDRGWRALTEAWLDGLGEVPAPARAWACRFMLEDLAKRHDPAALQHVRVALRQAAGGTP